ncbi:DUF3267 domain-containing protein [Virgibacillus siamensis]|uniref:DUF3267 domain-containing protein n=1 Tax=Virgibacillus siamensis TaxID=480071 RepID=UPI00098678E2|nr:DUF3267 domain-containing protein [Virgibacillus siamensis]
MKVRNKLPKMNEAVHVELIQNGWKEMKVPQSLTVAILLSIPFMILNGIAALWMINLFSGITLNEFGMTTQQDSLTITVNLGIILLIFLLVFIHELLHLIFIPNFLRSENTTIGLTLFGGYVATEEVITKSRYIIITVAPFIIISMLLPMVLGIIGALTPSMKLLIFVNAMASSVDILNLMFILINIPRKAIITNNGTKTYWKRSN